MRVVAFHSRHEGSARSRRLAALTVVLAPLLAVGAFAADLTLGPTRDAGGDGRRWESRDGLSTLGAFVTLAAEPTGRRWEMPGATGVA